MKKNPKCLPLMTAAAFAAVFCSLSPAHAVDSEDTVAIPTASTPAASSGESLSIAPSIDASAQKPISKNNFNLSQHWQEDNKHYNLACDLGAKFTKSGDRLLSLESGTFLIECETPISLKTPMSTIHLRANSMVLVRVQEGRERTYVLLETAHISCQHRSMSLRYGEEALVTDHAPFRGELAGESDVGLRQLRVHDLKDNHKLITMEYSLVQAMEREPLLTQIVHSEHNHDKFLRDKLLKAAAVLNMVTSRHGQYAGGY